MTKVTRIHNIIPLANRKKKKSPQDFKKKYNPDRPPDGAA